MYQGVIRSLKAKYHTNVVQKIIRSLEKNNVLPEVSILKAMQMLVSAWNAVSTETDLQNEIDVLRNIQPDLVPEDVNAASLTDVDAEVSAVESLLTDSEILAGFLETSNISDGDEEIIECARKSDLLLALGVLQKHF